MTTATRWVDLDGAANARDLGGLPLAGGGTTADNVVLRTDNLQDLSDRDVALLVEERGVQVVVDLRTGAELAIEGRGPLQDDPRVEIRHRSLYPETGGNTDLGVETVMPWQVHGWRDDEGETPAVVAYLGYLRDRPDSLVGALRDVAHTDGPVIVHCAAGKDRTGVVCALALSVAGVEREAIVADYVATGDRLEPLLARLARTETYGRDVQAGSPDRHRPLPDTMRRVLDLLDERHGGPEAWLDGHGFAADEREHLRRRLTGG